jgi:hypothetical protein
VGANARDVGAVAGLAVALLACACAKSTDADVRSAFEAAQRGGTQEPKARTRERGRRSRSRAPAPDDPWGGVHDKLGQAIAVFAKVVDASTFDALAERWCDVRPEPTETEDGRNYVCYPDPPLKVQGRSFTLELSASGVIGLLSDELTGVESRQFAERARDVASRFCATPFTVVRAEDPGPRAQEFHTCPSDAGVTLAVGRFPAAAAGDRWRVSVSVLGST